MSIYIETVRTKKQKKAFVQFSFDLYRGNKNWVPPLFSDEIDLFDVNKNPVFEVAEARLFLAYRGENIVGRLAAMIHWGEVTEKQVRKLRFGWFDFIDDYAVSGKLLEAAQNYAREKELDFIEGPVGFSNFDKAGMLTKGFDYQNTIVTWYNYPYYKKHMEYHGYSIENVWIEYLIDCPKKIPEKIQKYAKIIQKKYNLDILHFRSKKELWRLAEEIFSLIKSSYSKFDSYIPFTQKQKSQYIRVFMKFIHLDYIVCLKNNSGELVAFAVAMPSYTDALKKANGRIFPFGFFHMAWTHFFHKKIAFYLIGVAPKYQNKGFTAVIFQEFIKILMKKNIKKMETNPELIDNKNIQALWSAYDSIQHKTTYELSKTYKHLKYS